MREIKFRAYIPWDKKEPMYYSQDNLEVIAGDIEGGEMFFSVLNEMKQEGIDENDIEGTDDIILMQWTGLKDKNGKEVYEGDILSHTVFNLWKSIDVVSFMNGKFILLHHGETGKEEDILKYLDENEIIGNIYENKELINRNDTRNRQIQRTTSTSS